MKYLSTKEISTLWNYTERAIRKMCVAGKIDGAIKIGKIWSIPETAQKPARLNAKPKTKKEKFDIIQDLKNILDSKRPLTEAEIKRLNDEFVVDYTYNTNAIEGNTLTLQETTLVLQGITIDQKPLKEHMEAIGHKDAFYYVVDLVKNKAELNEKIIKEIHSLVLMNNPTGKGVYRQIPVKISGASHTPPQPYLVPKQMEDLIINFKKWSKTKNIVQIVSLLHLNFEFIHPFIDGNGRTGRLLVNLILMQNGFPPINIKFTDRKKYYDCFEKYHQTNKPDEMINLISDLLIERLKQYIDILK